MIYQIKEKCKKMKENHDKNTIVWTEYELTRQERKNFKKDYPGKRLCFRLRFPDAPLWISGVASVLGIISLLAALLTL